MDGRVHALNLFWQHSMSEFIDAQIAPTATSQPLPKCVLPTPRMTLAGTNASLVASFRPTPVVIFISSARS